MKRQFLSTVLALTLLTGCTNQSGSSPQGNVPSPEKVEAGSQTLAADAVPLEKENAANCPTSSSKVSLQTPQDSLIFERFNFRPTDIAVTADTVTFRNDHYGFVFCRGDRSWTVQSVEAEVTSEPEDYDAFLREIENPTYQSLDLEGQTYEARVRLEAAWLTEQGENVEEATDNPQEEVVFELIKPGETDPMAQVLYTLADLEARELGFQLGVPHLSQALNYGGDLWWSIGFERGEGASGIATIIQYDPETDQLSLWQPEALQDNNINDIAITGEGDEQLLWLGTQTSSEGNPQLPAQGLVAYRLATNSVKTYTVHNSPLVGAIPTRVMPIGEVLWVGTGNGACEIQWQTIDETGSWDCWQFTAEATVPAGGVALYDSLLALDPLTQVEETTIEVLWANDTDLESEDGAPRYEVSYGKGFEATLAVGADRYAEDSLYSWLVPAGLFWPGHDWHWNGARFLRSQDQVAENHFGGGPIGIGPDEYSGFINDWKVMRGDLDLLELTDSETRIHYYSGWVEADALDPYLAVLPVDVPQNRTPNPLEAIKSRLEPVDPFPSTDQ